MCGKLFHYWLNRCNILTCKFQLPASTEQQEGLSSMGSRQRLMDKTAVFTKASVVQEKSRRHDVNTTEGEVPWIHAGKTLLGLKH